LNSRVIRVEEIKRNIYSVLLECPEIACSAEPGQFVHIAVSSLGSTDPLLRRPMSICDVDPSTGAVEIVFRLVGKGTGWLAGRKSGESVDVIGPIGNGFKQPGSGRVPLLIAGGLGIAPLHFLAKTLASSEIVPYVLAGFATGSEAILVDRLSRAATVQLVTEDGSAGLKGKVTEHIRWAISWVGGPPPGNIELYVCGPAAMIKAVQDFCFQSGLSGQVSLESRMACGIGACLGCVQRVRSHDGRERYERVCVDGPVFDIRQVVIC